MLELIKYEPEKRLETWKYSPADSKVEKIFIYDEVRNFWMLENATIIFKADALQKLRSLREEWVEQHIIFEKI